MNSMQRVNNSMQKPKKNKGCQIFYVKEIRKDFMYEPIDLTDIAHGIFLDFSKSPT